MTAVNTWRRRIAALRLFHLLVLVGGLWTALLLMFASAQAISAPLNSKGFGLVVTLGLMAISLAVLIFRRISFSRKLKSYLGPIINVQRLPALNELRARMALFYSAAPEMIEFHRTLTRTRAPAEIIRDSEGTLHIALRYEILVDLTTQRRHAEAIIWHEFGHFLQWDTRLGYWSLRAVDLFGFVTFWAAVVASLVAIAKVGVDAINGRFMKSEGRLLILEICATLFLFSVFWFMRHWHRFCEFSADLAAAVAGYDRELTDFLTKFPDAHATKIKRLLGVHPSASRRIKFIRRVLKANPPNISYTVSGNMRLRIGDYVLGLLIYLVPMWLIFSVGAFVLTAASANLVH